MPRRQLRPLWPTALALAAAVAMSGAAAAGEPARRHCIAKIGECAMPAGFRHFDWVNPSAPKGGALRLSSVGAFETLNQHSFQGTSAPGVGWIDATLMTASPDEPATAYALVAEWVSWPDDLGSASFGLRREARFSDGRPVTPEDVVFSLDEQKRAHPAVAVLYRDVVRAEQTGEREVTFHFARKGSRDLIYITGLVTVLPRHWWTGRTAAGEPRDLAKSTLEPPVGAGPYRIKAVDRGRSITYERVRDWWGRDLPVNVGQYNFDELSYAMFRDDTPDFEALKSGDIDFREETSSKKWATGYDFPAALQGRLRKQEFELKPVAALQGFAFNIRRDKLSDPRVRRAIGLAYDFETANRSLFFGLFKRLDSWFDNSPLAARGLPAGRELELLERLRDKVPQEVFSAEHRSPRAGSAEALRANLREAGRLLDEAGWKVVDGQRRHERTGEPLTIEFLNYETSFDRIVLPFKQNLARIGVDLSIRIIDAAQYENRLKSYDFEMITEGYAQSHVPGSDLRERIGSEAASKPATANRIGIRNAAVDALVEEIVYARSREDLVAATRALDRVLVWNHYMVLQWYNPNAWLAWWDKLGRPARHPSQEVGALYTWWYDPAAAARLGNAHGKK